MAEPSYHPLSPLKYPLDGTVSPSPEQPFKEDSDLPHPADTVGATDPPGSRSSMYLAPLRSHPFRKGPLASRRPLWRALKTPLKMALLPLFAIAYLAFCYTVHGKAVPVKTYGLYAVTPQHLSKWPILSVSRFTLKTCPVLSCSDNQRWYNVYQYHHHIDRALPDLRYCFHSKSRCPCVGERSCLYGRSVERRIFPRPSIP